MSTKADNPPKGTRDWSEYSIDENNSEKGVVSVGKENGINTDFAKMDGSNGANRTPEATKQKETSEVERYMKESPYRPETPEQRKARTKKQKRLALMATLSDGISALSNIYHTSKGTPNLYNPNSNASERARVSFEKMKQERDGREKEYYTGLERARNLDLSIKAAREAREDRDKAAKQAQDNADRTYNFQEGQAKQAQDNVEKDRAEKARQHDAALESARKQRESNERIAKMRYGNSNATSNKKPYKTSDTDGKKITIYGGKNKDGKDNIVRMSQPVWDYLFPNIYEMMCESEGKRPLLTNRGEVEQYVKDHWYEYPEAMKLMLDYSSVNPSDLFDGVYQENEHGDSYDDSYDDTDEYRKYRVD